MNHVIIKILEIKQPIGTFYVGIINARDLFDICKAEVRRMEKDDIENYIGIQRPLNPRRVKEIKEYVKTFDASFPNTIVISINPEYLAPKSESNVLVVRRDKNAATIIDGQHRLSAFEDSKKTDFELVVTVFLGLEDEQKALLFSIINTKHTRINPSLATDLLEFSTINTPSKIAHNIAKTMNQDKNGPWYQKIKMIGAKSEIIEGEIITQKAFTEEIISLICKKEDLFTIRDNLKKHVHGLILRNSYNYNPKKHVLWDAYTDGADGFIFKALNNYFIALSKIFEKEWANPNYILCKTTGYKAFMKLFRKLYLDGGKEKDLSLEFFKKKIDSIKDNIQRLTSENYESGEKGVRKLAKDLGT